MAHRDYEEFFELLSANGVKFLIVGAHAGVHKSLQRMAHSHR